MAASNQQNDDEKVIHIPLIWLDADAYGDSNKVAGRRLSKKFGRCKFLTSTEECQKVIHQNSGGTKYVLIVSGQLGSTYVPKIHNNSSFSSIYVYCGNTEAHKEWAKNFSEVRCFLILSVFIIVSFI